MILNVKCLELLRTKIIFDKMWSTLHVSLNRKALCITTMGDQRRGREKRGLLKCYIVFGALNKENALSHFVQQNS